MTSGKQCGLLNLNTNVTSELVIVDVDEGKSLAGSHVTHLPPIERHRISARSRSHDTEDFVNFNVKGNSDFRSNTCPKLKKDMVGHDKRSKKVQQHLHNKVEEAPIATKIASENSVSINSKHFKQRNNPKINKTYPIESKKCIESMDVLISEHEKPFIINHTSHLNSTNAGNDFSCVRRMTSPHVCDSNLSEVRRLTNTHECHSDLSRERSLTSADVGEIYSSGIRSLTNAHVYNGDLSREIHLTGLHVGESDLSEVRSLTNTHDSGNDLSRENCLTSHICDCEQEDSSSTPLENQTNSKTIYNPSNKWSPLAIDKDTAISLKVVLFGSGHRSFNIEWKSQSFKFYDVPTLRHGLQSQANRFMKSGSANRQWHRPSLGFSREEKLQFLMNKQREAFNILKSLKEELGALNNEYQMQDANVFVPDRTLYSDTIVSYTNSQALQPQFVSEQSLDEADEHSFSSLALQSPVTKHKRSQNILKISIRNKSLPLEEDNISSKKKPKIKISCSIEDMNDLQINPVSTKKTLHERFLELI